MNKQNKLDLKLSLLRKKQLQYCELNEEDLSIKQGCLTHNGKFFKNQYDQIKLIIKYFVQNKIFFSKILAFLTIVDKKVKINYKEELQLELIKTLRDVFPNKNASELLITKQFQILDEENIIYILVMQIEEFLNSGKQVNHSDFTQHEITQITKLFGCASKFSGYSELSLIPQCFTLFIQNIKLISFHFQKIFDWKKITEQKPNQDDWFIDIDEQQLLVNGSQNQQIPNQILNKIAKPIPGNKRMDDFTIRFLMMKLVEQKIIYPSLLKFIRFTYQRKDLNNLNAEGIITIDPDTEAIRQICVLPQVEKFSRELSLPLFTQYVPKQVRETAMSKYPQFYLKSYFESLYEYVDQIKNNFESHIEELREIYREENFILFLKQIWNLGGKEIKDLIKNQAQTNYQSEGSNLISLGAVLFEIKLLIENKKEIYLDVCDIKNTREVCQNQRMHIPLLKLFFQSLNQFHLGYPQLLKLLHFTNSTLVQVDRKACLEELVQNSNFVQFIKYNFSYDIELHKPLERIELVFFTNKFIADSQVSETWPKIILKQLQIIYDQRQQHRQILREAVNSKLYQKNYLEINTDQQPYGFKQKIKEILRKINDFVMLY